MQVKEMLRNREIMIFLLTCIIISPCYKEVTTASVRGTDANSSKSPCLVDGAIYKAGERIPRSHPCHFCLCLQGRVQCAWQDCPQPPEDCLTLEFPNTCNPSLYLCQIPTILKVPFNGSRINRRHSDIGPEDINEKVGTSADCTILGMHYKTGDVVGAASHHCLECRCGRQDLYCSPRCCFRPSGLQETPGQIMKALIIGPKLAPKHPLHYLIPS